MNIYHQYRKRAISEPREFRDEIYRTLEALSDRCKENVLMLDERFRFNDPDLEDRCGLLNDRYEVFAAAIPQCRGYKLAVSVDFKGGNPPPMMLHGAVSAANACDLAKRLAVTHRRILNPVWE